MTLSISREIRLAARPRGWPTPAAFQLAETAVPEPGEGEVLVRNLWMSVDPAMRVRMDDTLSYLPPFRLGEPLEGRAVGQVVASRVPALARGQFVLSTFGWREAFVSRPDQLQVLQPGGRPLSAFLGVLGVPGLTAFVGLLDLARPEPGQTVFVSAAAGAVGSVVGQLARINGCRVVGSTGSDAKMACLLDELGFDAAINYKEADLDKALNAAAPDGIDVYFDNVGGDHLRAALDAMRPHGRVVLCGMVSQYNEAVTPPGPNNLFLAVMKRLTLRGFLVHDHLDRVPAFLEQIGGYLDSGRLLGKETIFDGIEKAPDAFLAMLGGETIGKTVVKLAASDGSL